MTEHEKRIEKGTNPIRCVSIRMFFEAFPSRTENDVFHCVECDVLISVMFASGE